MTARTTRRIGLCLVLFLLAGCGGKQPEDQFSTPTGPSVFSDGAQVRAVEITHDSLPAERVERLEAYGGQDLLRTHVEGNLRSAGRLDPSGELEVFVALDDFRLRSGASAFWWGALAGADKVVTDVHVMRDGAEIKSFKTDTSTILGGIAYASGTKRTRRLMKTLAERIVAGL